MKASRCVLFALTAVVAWWSPAVIAEAPEPAVQVHAYPLTLQPTDRLQDGPDGRQIVLEGETLLFWVDQGPGLFFAHPTAYLLISRQGVRVERGHWWPVLNDRTILYGKENSAVVTSPFELANDQGDPILVHVYPEELAPHDLLADGDDVSAFMWSHTFFIWVDLLPNAFFAHPTEFVLVTAGGDIITHHGSWWPLLNGKTVLYGTHSSYGVAFPFDLIGP